MAGATPNLDKLAADGMRFTDYYAEPELHRGPRQFHHRRAADPHRPHHRRPGPPQIGIPDEAPTIATALKTLGYETGQFGKNQSAT